ncbi:uncharacterized protein LOC135848912 [Planococcus citri]|uniref:uncharacterized protein LOC135848912 n=1 Tax=Planococcus citri TaxID=170843 RepID=UPI0031F9594B
MKTAVIVLLIAVMCIQSELSLGARSKNKNAKKTNANKPQTEQPIDNNQNVPAASTAPATSPATTSDDYPDVIIMKGDRKGAITIDGKTVEPNDSQLKKGIVWVNIGRGYIVINNNVILDRKPVKLGANITKFVYEGIDNFEMKVMKNGRVEYTDDTFDEGDLLSAQMY